MTTLRTLPVVGGGLLLLAGFGLGVIYDRSHVEAVQRTSGVAVTSTVPGRVQGIGQSPRVPLAGDVEFTQFWEMWRLLREKYYQPVNDKELFYGALSGLVAGAGDPYTNYFPPKNAEDFVNELDGRFEGIGAQIEVKNGFLQVVAPLEGTPAAKAGLRPADILVKIDQKSTDGLTVDEAVERIRGPRGTAVTLTISRASSKSLFDLTIIRDEIRVKSVKWSWAESGIARIEINQFNGDTPDLFKAALTEIAKNPVKGIILDVRNNPGGTLDSAQAVAGYWIGKETLLKERRQAKVVEVVKGTTEARLAAVPTVVLVNGGSASASEIVAGALQDYGKATLIGTKTFGKGSVQDFQILPDGGAVKITVAEWLTPKDRVVHEKGIEPDIMIDRTEADYEAERDPQLERARDFLRGKAPQRVLSP